MRQSDPRKVKSGGSRAAEPTPVLERQRKLQRRSGYDTHYISLAEAAEVLDVADSTMMHIEIYLDHVVIRPAADVMEGE